MHINSILLLHFNRSAYSNLLWTSASSLSFLRDVAIFYDVKKKRVQAVGEIDSCLKRVYVYSVFSIADHQLRVYFTNSL